MVASGTVTVRTQSQSRSATIQVNARNWGLPELPYNVATDKTDLGANHPAIPCGDGLPWPDPPRMTILGESCGDVDLPFPIVPSDYFRIVQGGPNDGLSYAVAVPGRLKIQTSVNTVALSQGSKFWSYQPAQPGPSPLKWGTYCGQAWVVNRPVMSGMHEGVGLTPDPHSHAGNLPTLWAQFYVKPIEKLVRRGYPLTTDIRGLQRRARPLANLQSQLETDDPSANWSWTIKCDLIWNK
jgi:hypothetical protein